MLTKLRIKFAVSMSGIYRVFKVILFCRRQVMEFDIYSQIHYIFLGNVSINSSSYSMLTFLFGIDYLSYNKMTIIFVQSFHLSIFIKTLYNRIKTMKCLHALKSMWVKTNLWTNIWYIKQKVWLFLYNTSGNIDFSCIYL